MDNLSVFVERLKEYMNDENLTAASLARKLNFSRATVSGILNCAHIPSTEILIAIVEYFNCSADYILGLTEIPENTEFLKVKPFNETLRACLKSADKTQYRLQKDLSLSRSLTYRWLHGNTLPTVNSLLILAKYFGCSVDYLLGREK